MRTQIDHRLNCKAHSLLRHPSRLVILIMRNIWRAVEKLIDTVSDIRLHNIALLALRMLVNCVTEVPKRHTRLHHSDSLVETLSRGLDHAHGIRVVSSFLADVISFVEVSVKAFVVERYVDVKNVAVDELALVGNAVADDFVEGGADGFGEVAVVQGGGV